MKQKQENIEVQAHPRILRSVSVVSFMTAISRVLGLVREIAMAYFFGTTALKSAFDIAFIIPNLFRRLFGEGALSSAFVPVFSETLEKEGREQAFKLAVRVISLLILVLGVITLLGILLTFPLAEILSSESRWQVPLPLLRVMLPYAVLICVAALISGMLNTFGKFGISSLTPFLLNLIWIFTLVISAPFLKGSLVAQIKILCWAILSAGLAQILFQLPALARQGFRFRLAFSGLGQDRALRRVLILMGPAALGIGLIQINVCVDKFLAFWADAAAPAALEYAERIVYLPLGMFGTAFMTVLLPAFSRQAARGDYNMMRATLERAIRNLAVIMAPCSSALIVLALPIVMLIYHFKGGRFDQLSGLLSARALMAYAPGLFVFSLQKAVMPAFYGLQDLRTPVRVSLFGLGLNIVLNVASVLLLPDGWKHVGIAGSTVFTSLVNGVTLAWILHKRIGAPRAAVLFKPVLKAVFCATVMAGVVWVAHGFGCTLMRGCDLNIKIANVLVMIVTIAAGGVSYAGLMFLISRQELMEMAGELWHRRQLERGA